MFKACRSTVLLCLMAIWYSGSTLLADSTVAWNLDELKRPPTMHWISQQGPVHSLLYSGEKYEGRETEVFAFYASPATLGNAGADDKFPGVVLIHGGGGTAFAEWAWLWAKRGYAAIAMDLSGSRPIDPIYDANGRPVVNQASKANSRTRLANGGPNQGHPEKFDSIGGDASDDWPYHAAASAIRAHSLLRTLPGVMPDRTAVTGISWGGYTTCLVASLDDRFRAAVPVYGCGFLYEGESIQKPAIDKLGDRRDAWIRAYDPSSLLARCRVPILFVNGTNDIHYPLDSYQKSFDLVPGAKCMRIEVNMRHGHAPGWEPIEIGLFIDSHCRDGQPLPLIGSPTVDAKQVRVPIESKVALKAAELHYTSDTGVRSQREWKSVNAEIIADHIVAPRPNAEANTWFLSVKDERGAMVTSAIQFVPKTDRNSDPSRPNVLVIVSDDQGYVDAGFQGGTEIATPHLDKLAASGVRCTNGYVSHPFCSPTRAGLLTGRYQARFGHEYNPVYDPLDKNEGLPLSERLLPEYMKAAGYKTGWIGKWHLGASPDHAPWKRGFDETFGFIGGGHAFTGWTPNQRQYTLPLTRGDKSLTEVPDHLTTALGQEASAFINRNSDHPWFLYLAFNAPHTPHQPTAEREKRFAHISDSQRRRYLAQVSLMDDAIGSVTAALAESGQVQRTLVFFMSDNGGPVKNGANNGLLKGQKGQVYEGGVRVPYIVSWPGKLPADDAFNDPVSSLDVFATSLAASGTAMPQDKVYDGVDLLPFLRGQSKSPPHKQLFWRAALGKARAVRDGRWKLVSIDQQPLELYDLSNDLSETKNLASEKPDVANRLANSLADWEKEMIPPVFLGSSVKSEDWGPGGSNQKKVK